MADKPSFDLTAAHRYFSAYCFNKAWDLMDQPSRSAEEDAEMLRLSMASTWHWMQREDCKAENLSVGYWQTSRIYVLLRKVDEARHYAQLSLDAAQYGSAGPFFLAYAYEALARAEAYSGQHGKKDLYLNEARRLAQQVENADDRHLLEADLASIK